MLRSPLAAAALMGALSGLGPFGCYEFTEPKAEQLSPGDEGEDTDAAAPDSGSPDSGDLVDEVSGTTAVPVFAPNGGGFVGDAEVHIESSTGAGTVWYCLAPPDETDCTLRAYDGPVNLDESTVVHAEVRAGQASGALLARSFYQVDGELEGWSSDLPVLVFWTDADLPTSTSTRTPVAMDVREPGSDGRTSLVGGSADSGRARLRPRGSSSSSFDKLGYDLEIWQPDSEEDREVGLLGMPEDADWILYGAYYYDDALFRNSLAYQTSRDVGRYAPRTRHVEVFAAERGRALRADDYLGAYSVIEEVERGPDRVDVAGLDPDDVDDPEITGGYIIKRDRPDEDDASIDCGTAGGQIYYEYGLQAVDPEEHELEREQLSYLRSECDALGWAVVSADFTDPSSGRHYSEIIDTDSFIDHHILNVIFKNPDAFRLSGYLFKDRESLIEAGPIWDFDRACDSSDSRASDPTWWDASNQTWDTTYVFEDGWYARLMEDPDYALAYWTRWEELLADELSAETMDARIVAMADELEEAAERNHARWGGESFGSEVTSLRAWMAARHAWISDCIAAYEDPRLCRGG